MDKSDEVKCITLKAVDLFWKIIKESTSADMNLYVARSYAYIGHILARRLSLVKDDINIFSDSEIGDMLESPLAVLEKAYELAPDDTTVLNRYGRSLWNNSERMESNAKIQLLKKAEDILTKSVEKNSKRNWFAYATRQIVRRDIVNTLHADDSSKEQYIKLAIADGHQCFLSKGTLTDMTILADMCQKLAKFPDIYKYGPQFVRDKHHLCQAIEYLYYGNRLGDPPEYHSATRMASCLADFGECVKAIEWQKRAWLLAYKTSTYAVYILCLYMTCLIEEEFQKQNTINHLLRDFLLVLSHAKKQYKYNKIVSMYENLYTRRRGIMFTIIDNYPH